MISTIIHFYCNMWCASAGREMNIQVATSEIPVPSIRGSPRLSGSNFTQRPQTRFRGSRGTGVVRGMYNSIVLQTIIETTLNSLGFFIIKGRGTGRRGGRGGTRPITKTPTAEELDAELEAYVKEVK